jgi:hypothetical protein
MLSHHKSDSLARSSLVAKRIAGHKGQIIEAEINQTTQIPIHLYECALSHRQVMRSPKEW